MGNKSYSQIRKEFYEAYQQKIVPSVKIYESERKIRLALAIVCFSILFILASIILYYTLRYAHEKDFRPALAIYVFAFIAWGAIKKNFENKLKTLVMSTVCRCYNNLKWVKGSNYDKRSVELYSVSNLIPYYNSECYDDIFYGSHNDVNFEIVEAQYQHHHGKTTDTVFDGVIIKLDMNKSFSGNTLVKHKTFSLFNGKYNTIRKTSLEDPEFNRMYDVYTDDEVEARYLLTPTFMERLKNMEVAFSAKGADCAFYDKYLLIALHTNKDLFSLCSLVKPVDDSKQYFQMYDEIVSIIKLIDHFKLDQKIGL